MADSIGQHQWSSQSTFRVPLSTAHATRSNDDEPSVSPNVTTTTTTSTSSLRKGVAQPFGRQEYWESLYRDATADFSWYSGWDDLCPFVEEFLPLEAMTTTTTTIDDDEENSHSKTPRILIPGVGTDAALLIQMHRSGYTHLSAFDYAPEAAAYLTAHAEVPDTIALTTADARDLQPHYDSASFDAILDKGTLDAVYLAGATLDDRRSNVEQSVREFHRVLAPGGVLLSLSGICTDAVREVTAESTATEWECLTDGSSLYATETGYTSNNLDGTFMVWRKPVIS